MSKSTHTREYRTLLRLLREARETAGITQVELASRLKQTQSFVSKIERGEARLDVVQLRGILQQFDVTLSDFVVEFERKVARH